MNVKKLQNSIKLLKDDLGEGLMAADIYSSEDGQSIVGINSNPQACALFNRITNYLREALKAAGFPLLGRHYMIDLTGGHMVVVIPLGDYQWVMMLDMKKIQLGLLLNIVLPKVVDAFEDALAE